MPVFTLECEHCRVKTTSYNLWRKHLLEENHQEEARERNKLLDLAMKDKKKSIVVFGLSAIKKKDVLKYFGDLTIVLDFIFWKERQDFCIIKFTTTKFRDNVMLTTHNINQHQLLLRSRNLISDVEWISICPYVVASFLKMETDPTENTSAEDPFNDSSDEDQDREDEEVPSHSTTQDESIINLERQTDEIIENDDESAKLWNVAYNEEEAEVENSNSTLEEVQPFDSPSINLERQNEYANKLTLQQSHHDPEKVLNSTLQDMYDVNLMPLDNWKFRNEAKQDIQHLLEVEFPKCVLIPFGAGGSTAISSGHEVYSIFADVYGNTAINIDNDSTSENHILMDLNRDAQNLLYKSIFRLLNAGSKNTCITQLKYVKGNEEITFLYIKEGRLLKCKIQVTNFVAVQSCRIMNFMCKLDDRVRPLLIVARYWAYHHNLVKSNPTDDRPRETCFHPTVIQWLVVFFLIHKNIIPSVHKLQNHAEISLIHKGVDISFCNDAEKIGWERRNDFEIDPITGNPSARCILTLAKEMFARFSEIDFSRQIISVNIGKKIPKLVIVNEDDDKYFENQRSAWNCTRKLDTRYVCIQHPLKLSINMTNEVSVSLGGEFNRESYNTASVIRELLEGSSEIENPVKLLTIRYCATSATPLIESLNTTINESKEDFERDAASAAAKIQSSEGKKKMKKKIPTFFITFNITESYRSKAASLMSSKLQYANLKDLWLKFFKDFNSIVWLKCFGIRLFSLSDNDDDVPETVHPWTCHGPPLKGVLINPEKFAWANKKFKSKKSKQIQNLLASQRLDYIKMLKMSNPRNIDSIDSQSHAEIQIQKEKLLTFYCHISVNSGKNNDKCSVRLQFRKMKGTEIEEETRLKNQLSNMYSYLWDVYSEHRLITANYG